MKIQLNESYYWDEKVCISFTPEKKKKNISYRIVKTLVETLVKTIVKTSFNLLKKKRN
jgi:hypothetical protein